MTVEFRALSIGAGPAGRYKSLVNDDTAHPIHLGSYTIVAGPTGDYFKVVLVGDALDAISTLGLDAGYFKNRLVRATGFVRRTAERRRRPDTKQVRHCVRHEIIVGDLKHFEIVPEGLCTDVP